MEELKEEMRALEIRKMKAYNDWIKCQNRKDREGYHIECKKLYDIFSELMREEQDLLYKMHQTNSDFKNFQKSVSDMPSNSRTKRSPKFPKTVILAVTIHGGYILNRKKDDFAFFKLPEGMTLRTVTAAPAGVGFFTCEKSTSEMIESVIKAKNMFTIKDESDTKKLNLLLDEMTLVLAESFRTRDASRLANLATLSKNKKRKFKNETELKDFSINHSDKTYQVHFYNNREEVPHKGFQIKYKDILRRSSETTSEIKILNMNNTPNLADETWFDLDRYTWEHPEEGILADIDMVDVIMYLHKFGVENVILLDFSCSNVDVGPRETRLIRKRLTSRAKKSQFLSRKRTRRSRSRSS